MSAISSRRRAVAWSTTCRPAGGDGDLHGPAVRPGPLPADQPLADQPVAHPPGRRGRDGQRRGQVHHPLRAAGREDHQRPVLGDRGVLRRGAQRHGRHRDQCPARRQHRVHRGLVYLVLRHCHPGHFACILRLLCSDSISHYNLAQPGGPHQTADARFRPAAWAPGATRRAERQLFATTAASNAGGTTSPATQTQARSAQSAERPFGHEKNMR